jgi:predicted Zn-dependent peptidase
VSQRLVAMAVCGLLLAAGLAVADLQLSGELPPFGPEKPLALPPIAQSKTPEGLTVWIVRRPSFPRVAAVLAVRGGAAVDPADLPGIASLLATTVKAGTETRSSRQITDELQAIGGEIRAEATVDGIFLTATGPSAGVDRLLAVLADAARHATFPDDEVELAKTRARQDAESWLSAPDTLGAVAFARALYRDHPYRIALPTPSSITAATPAILRREFRRRFRPERALLVVVGDVDPVSTGRAITAALGGWSGVGEAPAEIPAGPTTATHGIYLVDRPGAVQSVFFVGSTAPAMAEADYYPLLLANTIFGGSPGSRLRRNLRENKGYSYAPESVLAPRRAGSRWRLQASVRTEVTAATLNEIRYELDRLGTTDVTAEELESAKRYACGHFLIDNQLGSALAGTLATSWVNGLPPDTLGELVSRVKAVTLADVNRVVRSFLPFHRQVVLVVGDGSRVKQDLEQIEPVTVVQP